MESWPERIAEDAIERDAALAELRQIVLRGLRVGLSGRAGSDEAFLEDVTQVTLVKIVKSLDTFQGRSKFESWALAIAHRVAYSELRRKEWGNVSLDELREQQTVGLEEADSAPGPDEVLDRQSLASLLRSVIESDLTERQGNVLLSALNGMPQEEIARQLGTNRNNVYKIYHDARRAAKGALIARGHDKAFFFGGDGQSPQSTASR